MKYQQLPVLAVNTAVTLFLLLNIVTRGDGAALCNAGSADPDVTCPDDVINTFTSIQEAATTSGVLDVVFVIDEGALTAPQHYWTKQFLHAFSQMFVISPEYTKVALVTFSGSARVVVSLASNADMCSFATSVHNMTLQAGSSYLSTGLNAAITELQSGRSVASKLTVLITNGGWGNLGADPEQAVNTLKNLGYVASIILKHPNQSLGLIKNVIFNNFVSFFGSKRLGFTVNMTPEYLRGLHSFTKHTKAMGTTWQLDMEVDRSRCATNGQRCSIDQSCVCEIRSLHSEYICVGKDVDPPEAIQCEGPKSPIHITDGSLSTTVTWELPKFSDNTGIVRVVSDKLPGLYQVGQHTVVATAKDKNGNTATCSFSFTVTN